MSFSAVTARGVTNERTLDNSIAVSPDAAIAVGRAAFAVVIGDNISTTGGNTTDHTVTDTDTHTWTRVYEHTVTAGAADDGFTLSLWMTVVTSEIGTSDSITCTFAANITSKCIHIFEATMGAGNTLAVEAFDTDDGGAAGATLASMTSREYLLIGTAGRENEDTNWTADSDYTTLQESISSAAGATTSNVAVGEGYRIATLTGDTFFPGALGAGDKTIILAAIYEVAGGTTYDETGKTFTITSSLAITEQVTRGELGKTVSISSTVSATDVATFVDNKTISMALTLALTDVATFLQDLGFTINATITGTDAPVMVEDGKQIALTATITGTDAAVRTEDALVTVTATLTETDVQTMEEPGLAVNIAATIAGTDGFSFTEVLALSILATIAETDDLVPGGGGGGITPNSWELLGILKEMCEARGLTPGDMLAALNRLAGTTAKDAVAALQAMGATSGEIVGAINELSGVVPPKELIGALRAWASSGNF